MTQLKTGVLLVATCCVGLTQVFAADRPNLVVLMVDTLRADLGGAQAPRIQQLCESGLRFPNANSATPSTRSSIASLLTGVGPEFHGVRHGRTHLNDFRGSRLVPLLKTLGYHTYGFVTNPNVDSAFGHATGFDQYHELYRVTDRGLNPAQSEELVTHAGELAKHLNETELEEPFFAFVLAIDPHRPYTPPTAPECTAADAKNIKCYAAEVEFLDTQLPKILEPFGDAVIFFTSDHGEEFGEHGQWAHGRNVYETSTHVPLCIAGAGKGVRTERVDTLDITATLVELAGGEVPRTWLGRNLPGKSIPRRYVISLWEPQKALRWGEEKKFIREEGIVWFDLAKDPGETQPHRRGEAEVDEQTIEILKSLGYIQ